MKALTEKELRLLNICKVCPLYSIRYGGQCNPKLFLDPKTDAVSTTYKAGYINGCGCLLQEKIKGDLNTCPAGKWKD